jgi:hypothetical protein
MNYVSFPKLIGVPNNKVSKTSGCADMGYSVKKLNDLFMDGYLIDFENMKFNCKDVHIYTNYIYKNQK